MNKERLMKDHTLKTYSMYDLAGEPDEVIQKLRDDVDYARSRHPGFAVWFDVEYWMRGDDEPPHLLLRVNEPESDKEYQDRMALMKEQEDRARKQYEELKKRFEK